MTSLLIFRSADDRDFDKYIFAPPRMSIAIAWPAADAIVAKVKATGDWQWDDIETALVAAGFVPVNAWAHCDQEV